MKKIFVSLLLLIVCVAFFALDNRSLSNVSSLSLNYSFLQGEPFVVEYESFALNADSGALMHDLTVELSLRTKGKAQPMSGGLTLVTGELVESYCLLPNGEHFSSPARITIPYDVHRIPMGYEPNDVYSYYYDEEVSQWTRLERVEVDTINHTITSLTTHFTEFANAVIKVPEMPEAKAFVPTAMTDVPDVNPLQGIPMIAAPTANNRGTAELTYPIEVPRGRRGLQPNIDLHYSSAGGNGILGVGWSMSVPAITIDTRWGVPRYSEVEETEAYLLNGEQVLLHDYANNPIPLPHQALGFEHRRFGNTRFYARDKRNQDYIIRVGTSPMNYYWCVTDRVGTKYYYGFDPFSNCIDQDAILMTDEGNIAEWSLSAIVDVFGNYVRYSYFRLPREDGNLNRGYEHYLSSISYTGNYNFQDYRDEIIPYYVVHFVYNNRPDILSDGRLGFLSKTTQRLCVVKIIAGKHIVASYKLDYDCHRHTLNKSRLNGITKYDAFDMSDCDQLQSDSKVWRDFFESQQREALNVFRASVGDGSYDDYVYPTEYGSRTDFSYYDAAEPENLFLRENSTTLNIGDIGHSVTYSSGGGADVGFGFGQKPSTDNTIGVNGSFNYGNGRSRSALMDMNGDGLPDYVYMDGHDVYYRKQILNGRFSRESKKVRGLCHLVVDNIINYDLGVQGSFSGVGFKAKPLCFTNNVTSSYFCDVNNDRLPDFIQNEKLYICHLNDDGNPEYEYQSGDSIPVYVGQCVKNIVHDGYVDEKIECRIYYVLDTIIDFVVSDPYQPLIRITDSNKDEKNFMEYSDIDNSHYIRAEDHRPFLNNDDLEIRPLEKSNCTASDYMEESLATDANPTILQLEDIYSRYSPERYSVQRGEDGYYIYRLESDCRDSSMLPNIDVVRVWVAPRSGYIQLESNICLINDGSISRTQSRGTNGVGYFIQHCDNVELLNGRLHAQRNEILSSGTILPSEKDTIRAHSPQDSILVSEGDVLLFRLSAMENRSFDDVYWVQNIKYCDGAEIYNSKENYLCWNQSVFQAPISGSVSVNIDASYYPTDDVIVRLRHNSQTIDSLILTDSINHKTISALSLNSNDIIDVQVVYLREEPLWSALKLSSMINFSATDTSIFGGQVFSCPIGYTIDGEMKSVYSGKNHEIYQDLFGVLYKNWGHFGFNDIDRDSIIVLDSLYNYYTELQADFGVSTSSQDRKAQDLSNRTLNWKTRLKNLVDSNNLEDMLESVSMESIKTETKEYNAFSDDHKWVSMSADISANHWVVLGNLGALGAELQSTSMQPYNTEKRSEIEYVNYDSSIPVLDDYTRVKTIRKRRFSWSAGLSLSVEAQLPPISMDGNLHISGGISTVGCDYMDLNGDGFPDVVGYNSVQYSTPWGGIGKIKNVDNPNVMDVRGFEHFSSTDLSFGGGVSGSFNSMEKQTTNNIKKNNTFSAGGGRSIGNSWANVTYMDMNADGLPDMVDRKNHKVRYNIGYKFSNEYPLLSNQSLDFSTTYSVGDNESIARKESEFFTNLLDGKSYLQYSYGGGVSFSQSSNWMKQMIDIDGDGYLDMTIARDNVLELHLNNYNLDYSSPSVSLNDIREPTSTTHVWNANFSFSLPIYVFVFKYVVNPQCDILSRSESFTGVEWVDMNADGYVDLLVRDSKTNQVQLIYNTNGVTPVNCLQSVTNPTGQILRLEYSKSVPSINRAGSHWLLTSVLDSIPQNQILDESGSVCREFKYHSALYDCYEKTDYGYESVETIDKIVNHNSNKDLVYRIMRCQYSNQNYLTRGELVREEYIKGKDTLCIVKNYEKLYGLGMHNHETDLCNDLFLKPYEECCSTEYYDFNRGETKPKVTTAYTLKYDDFHNLIQRIDYGDVNVPDDDVIQDVTFYTDTLRLNNLISLPIEEYVWGNKRLLRHSTMNHDSILGVPTHISLWNDSIECRTNLVYDVFGSILQVQQPQDSSGEHGLFTYVYDNPTHTYPVRIVNPFGECQQFHYDLSFGIPDIVTDIAGNSIYYMYDPLGRLVDVVAPNEQINRGFTIHYDYHQPFYQMDAHSLKTIPAHNHQYVTKFMRTQNCGYAGAECVFYDARGTSVQHQKYLSVFGKNTWVVQGATRFDNFGRLRSLSLPFVSTGKFGEFNFSSPRHPITTYSYDVLDRCNTIKHPNKDVFIFHYGFASDVNNVMRFCHGQFDENGVYSEQLLSPQGWTIQQNNPEKQNTFYRYNAIGELRAVVDADGYTTKYEYDMLGRMIHRYHPDANDTYWKYDAIGNVISVSSSNLQRRQLPPVEYVYMFNRLVEVHYPLHEDLDISYYYNSAGRLVQREDASGVELFSYDALGNVNHSRRLVFLPTESYSFEFNHDYEYDSFGRIRSIVYPDGDSVRYNYYNSGQLASVSHTYQGKKFSLIKQYDYDEMGRKAHVVYGNDVETKYTYSPDRQWLQSVHTYSPQINADLQDLSYTYDGVGNITQIQQHASSFGTFGGQYVQDYTYDGLNRLVTSQGRGGQYDYDFDIVHSPTGRMGHKVLQTSTGRSASDLFYGYDANFQNHQPRVIFDKRRGSSQNLYWEANGNLSQMVDEATGEGYVNIWDEENRLRMVVSPKYAGYYGYDANGERVYKITGNVYKFSQNASWCDFGIDFEDITVYPSPYMVLTKEGYTKHFYAGTEKIATLMGDGGLACQTTNLKPGHEKRIVSGFMSQITGTEDFVIKNTVNASIENKQDAIFQYGKGYYDRVFFSAGNIPWNLLDKTVAYWQGNPYGINNEVFFTHTGHLGSASWITDKNGKPIQYMHYAPYGELIANYAPYKYDERFKFTGKERDRETGYDFFSARYYFHLAGIWLGVDPLTHKYPGVTPYIYCGGNPIKYIDPDGKDVKIFGANNSRLTLVTSLVDVSFDISKLGLDFGGDFSCEATLDEICMVLDMGGCFDPTPTCDVASATLQYESGDARGAVISALSVVPGCDVAKCLKGKKYVKAFGGLIKKIHGNSKFSEAAQHLYEIFEKVSGKVAKTGVSGGKINRNGKSYRAQSQVNKLNKKNGFEKYDSRVVDEVPAGPGARDKILQKEKENADRLRTELDPDIHKRP